MYSSHPYSAVWARRNKDKELHIKHSAGLYISLQPRPPSLPSPHLG